MTTTITPEQQAAIEAYLDGRHIQADLGTKEAPCSIAAINLALSGHLTDEIPDCMSDVIGRWIIIVQDAMPDEMRNGEAWRRLLPLAAGTGQQHEAERLAIILDWMWGTVLPTLQPLADKHGFGAEWRRMVKERTKTAAYEAAGLARGAVWEAAWEAAQAAAKAAQPAQAAAWAAWAARSAVAVISGETAWALFEPPALLEKLITLDGGSNG